MMADGFSYPPSSQGFPTSTGFGQGLAQVFNFQPLQDKLFGYEDKFIKLDEELKQKVADEKKRIANLGQEQINAMNIDPYYTRDYATRGVVQGIVSNMQGLLKDPNVKMYLDKKMPSNPNSEALQKYKALETQFKSLSNIEAQKKAIDEANLAAVREGKIVPTEDVVASAYGQLPNRNPVTYIDPGQQQLAANQAVQQRGAPYPAPVAAPANLPSNLVANAAGNVSGVSNLGTPAPGDTPIRTAGVQPSQLQANLSQMVPGYSPIDPNVAVGGGPRNMALQDAYIQNNFLTPGVAVSPIPFKSADLGDIMSKFDKIMENTAQKLVQETPGGNYDQTIEMIYNSPEYVNEVARTILASDLGLQQQLRVGLQNVGVMNPTAEDMVGMLSNLLRRDRVSQTSEANPFALQNQKFAQDLEKQKQLYRLKGQTGEGGAVGLMPKVTFRPNLPQASKTGGWSQISSDKPWEFHALTAPEGKQLSSWLPSMANNVIGFDEKGNMKSVSGLNVNNEDGTIKVGGVPKASVAGVVYMPTNSGDYQGYIVMKPQNKLTGFTADSSPDFLKDTYYVPFEEEFMGMAPRKAESEISDPYQPLTEEIVPLEQSQGGFEYGVPFSTPAPTGLNWMSR